MKRLLNTLRVITILVLVGSVTLCTKTIYPVDRTADLEIAKIVVWGQTLPDDFTPLGVDRTVFTSVFHMKSKQIDATAEKQFELSTDDESIAMEWEETIAATYPVYTPLYTTEKTDLYYDIVRRASSTSFLIIYNRVFKKSAFDRDGVDLDNPNGYYGKINITPLTPSVVERITEYMWYFQLYDKVGYKVISSEAIETEFEIVHTLVEASRDTSFDLNNIGVCMEITVYETEYTLDKDTKELWEGNTNTRTFYAKRRDPGVIIDLCEGPLA